ncbi:DNA pilot protein [Microviridae sp.]|nr:DNA pilot protein [Microviridae sp.]
MSDLYGIGATVTALGDAAGAAWSARKAAAESRANREFQALMSNTSYRRAVVDMKAAGINPILAYQQGGASSPSGSMASMPDLSGIGSGVANTALAARRLGAEVKKIGQDTNTGKAQEGKLKTSQALDVAQTELAEKQAAVSAAQLRQVEEQTRRMRVETRLQQTRLPAAEFDEWFDSTYYGKALRAVSRTSASLQGRSPLGPINPTPTSNFQRSNKGGRRR